MPHKPHNPDSMEQTASHEPMRRCIVCGESLPKAQLLRYVASPEGQVVFDVKHTLPGRGMWVSADKLLLRKAIEQNLFSRSAKRKVSASPQLEAQTDTALRQRIGALLKRAHLSREMVTGFELSLQSLRHGQGYLLFQASDAAEDGARKLQNAAQQGQKRVTLIRDFSRDEMAAWLNLENPVHAVVTSKPLAEVIEQVYKVWAGFMKVDAL